MQNSIYKIKYLLFLSWDWEAWCLTQSGRGGVIPPERNTTWNKGRKCFHRIGAPNNLIRPWVDGWNILAKNHLFEVYVGSHKNLKHRIAESRTHPVHHPSSLHIEIRYSEHIFLIYYITHMHRQITDVKMSDDFGSLKTTNFARMNVEIFIFIWRVSWGGTPFGAVSLNWA